MKLNLPSLLEKIEKSHPLDLCQEFQEFNIGACNIFFEDMVVGIRFVFVF